MKQEIYIKDNLIEVSVYNGIVGIDYNPEDITVLPISRDMYIGGYKQGVSIFTVLYTGDRECVDSNNLSSIGQFLVFLDMCPNNQDKALHMRIEVHQSNISDNLVIKNENS